MSWRDYYAAKAAVSRNIAWSNLRACAAKLLPDLSPEDAAAMRAAMDGLPSQLLRELVADAQRAVPC